MDTVYSDDIWIKSECRDFEKTTYKTLKSHVKDPENILVHLIDIIPNDTRLPVTDNYCKKNHLALWPEFYGGFYYKPDYVNRPPQKLFSCFINRVDFFRQSWLYQFVRRRLLDKGCVSFRLDYRDIDLDPEISGDPELLFEHFFAKNKIFAEEHTYLKNKVPFTNFNSTLEQAIIDSKVNLILETYFVEDHAVAFSEKIFRSLLLPRPFLLFNNPGAVEHLRRCGFDVFDDIVDHSYDNLHIDGVVKQLQMLDQLEHFKNVEYDAKMIARLRQGCYHNTNRLKQLKELWPSKLQSTIDKLGNNELR